MREQDSGRAVASIEEVAQSFGIARSTAYDLAKADRLPVPVIRLGRRVVVSRVALDRVLAGEPRDARQGGRDAAA